jgi:hypothetical protein
MTSRLGFKFGSTELERFKGTRNELVHRLLFSTDDPFREFQRILSFADRLIMGLLAYRGPYMDVETLSRVERPVAAAPTVLPAHGN